MSFVRPMLCLLRTLFTTSNAFTTASNLYRSPRLSGWIDKAWSRTQGGPHSDELPDQIWSFLGQALFLSSARSLVRAARVAVLRVLWLSACPCFAHALVSGVLVSKVWRVFLMTPRESFQIRHGAVACVPVLRVSFSNNNFRHTLKDP